MKLSFQYPWHVLISYTTWGSLFINLQSSVELTPIFHSSFSAVTCVCFFVSLTMHYLHSQLLNKHLLCMIHSIFFFLADHWTRCYLNLKIQFLLTALYFQYVMSGVSLVQTRIWLQSSTSLHQSKVPCQICIAVPWSISLHLGLHFKSKVICMQQFLDDYLHGFSHVCRVRRLSQMSENLFWQQLLSSVLPP